MVNSVNGPRAIRHIRNPFGHQDEGIRIVWPDQGENGDREMADWPRRDALLSQGRRVRATEGDVYSLSALDDPFASHLGPRPATGECQGGVGGMWPLVPRMSTVDITMGHQ
ncbi:hypothetical protein BD324DRAFT_612157 [Kockovaella imperatae]|uniref:Uncharacterized protein n=1 Tax=Kockovaella imperatae TaxID=4999 RepID=A0A1Y1UUD4_9TREE|nr:hypothetical protein BD324DRAFT_612157 [Kockovaella imperatae]ORX40805.1 hypothetical protein BD324DRAFT_612157 [Kockovaella imperatae]